VTRDDATRYDWLLSRLRALKRPKWLQDVAALVEMQASIIATLQQGNRALQTEVGRLRADLHRIDAINQQLDAKLADIMVVTRRAITVPTPGPRPHVIQEALARPAEQLTGTLT